MRLVRQELLKGSFLVLLLPSASGNRLSDAWLSTTILSGIIREIMDREPGERIRLLNLGFMKTNWDSIIVGKPNPDFTNEPQSK